MAMDYAGWRNYEEEAKKHGWDGVSSMCFRNGEMSGNGVRYCSLYDEGHKRLGCIGCPIAGARAQKEEFARWPKYREAYLKAFQRMIDAHETTWCTAEEVMAWWLQHDD